MHECLHNGIFAHSRAIRGRQEPDGGGTVRLVLPTPPSRPRRPPRMHECLHNGIFAHSRAIRGRQEPDGGGRTARLARPTPPSRPRRPPRIHECLHNGIFAHSRAIRGRQEPDGGGGARRGWQSPPRPADHEGHHECTSVCTMGYSRIRGPFAVGRSLTGGGIMIEQRGPKG